MAKSATRQSPFQKALEIIEILPTDQQQDFIDLLKRRLAEERRDEIAASIRETKEAYAAGELDTGSISDLMKALNS